MASKRRIVLLAVLIVWSVATVMGCGGSSALTSETGAPLTVYLKNNIHYQDRPDRAGKTISRASYANYIDPGAGHQILPLNTAVNIASWRGGFTITRISDGKLIYFEYNSNNMGMDVKSYLDLITSPSPVSIQGLSQIDLDGIRDGKAEIGMSKDGIRMALGYPAVHRTPSLDAKVWTYWRNRWVMQTVEFDGNGKVVEIK
jgi:hypothetical protein